ncbi:FxSxx-COOH system tetratricopeptide repeat protein [Dactylosporangium sp. CA-092794]|uniref:FxSxx-COOH system tetratricopeptide repeat protein n=1 Tax=Dactylosporangium sp. CA-092794 TaxID=3239929 RepID=UPI003D89FFEB
MYQAQRDIVIAQAPVGSPPPRGPAVNAKAWTVVAPVATFTARDTDLTALGAALETTGRVVLHGIPGVGKTQLALAWAHKHADRFDIAWQIRATSRLSAMTGLAQLTGPLELTLGPDQEQAASAVVAALCHRDRWLLVFDDAAPDTIRGLIPPRGGQVLITSRNPYWDNTAATQEVGLFPPQAAASFLMPKAGHAGRVPTDAAVQLAERLGYLPLALEQARAYCTATGRTLTDYLDAIQQHRLLRYGIDDAQHLTVDATITLAVNVADHQHPAAPSLMQLFAHLAAAPIPRALATVAPHQLPAPLRQTAQDQAAYDRALQVLAELALIDIRDGTIRVHQLVAEIIRHQHPTPSVPWWRRLRARRVTWPQITAQLLAVALPAHPDDPGTWSQIAVLYPHITTIAEHLPPSADDNAARLLTVCGLYAQRRGELREAERLLGEAHIRLDRSLGGNHPGTLGALNNLAEVLARLGELDHARALHERILSARRRLLGTDHADTLTSLNNLADVLVRLGELARARAMHEQTLRTRRRIFGADHADTLTSMNNLALVLARLGELGDARMMHEQTLQATQRNLGVDHPDTLASMNNLAGVLAKLGRTAEARAMYTGALTTARRVLGESHPNTLTLMHNLADVLAGLGELAEARSMHEHVLAARRRILGENHPETLASTNKLAALDETVVSRTVADDRRND